MDWLMIRLVGGMASFGGIAPGGIRQTEREPTRSALLGLCAAALGLRRDQVDEQRALGSQLRFAARVSTSSQLLRDYHTAQAPPEPALKGRPRRTRKDELSVPKDDLNTVLSDRYYYSTYAAIVGIQATAPVRLDKLHAAFLRPQFVLYLGRKSCPLAWPMAPRRVAAEHWLAALEADVQAESALLDKNVTTPGRAHRYPESLWLSPKSSVHWIDADLPTGPLDGKREHIRWDEPIDTARRLFAPRKHWRAQANSQRSST